MKITSFLAMALSTSLVASFAHAQAADEAAPVSPRSENSSSEMTAPAADTPMTDAMAADKPAVDNTTENAAAAADEKTPAKTDESVKTAAPAQPAYEAPAAATAAAPTAPAAPARASLTEAKPSIGGDLRAPSPKILDENRRGYFQAGIGPAYGIGFESDSLMYNILGSYNMNMNDRVTGKVLVDMYMGTGSVSSRMINIGLGADIYAPEINPFSSGLPYFSGEVALGNGRNALEETATGVTLGAGAGFRFQASDLNWDISANYALLTAPVGNTYPSIIGARAAVNF